MPNHFVSLEICRAVSLLKLFLWISMMLIVNSSFPGPALAITSASTHTLQSCERLSGALNAVGPSTRHSPGVVPEWGCSSLWPCLLTAESRARAQLSPRLNTSKLESNRQNVPMASKKTWLQLKAKIKGASDEAQT